ncbi:RHS repeat-associated core domain-containing protein [Cryocola sp. 340MFSha3.1]|uniref:RHS repeat-associated core domain-containing protein n=1 Tax=Cryocola sp. 340MFSha3.1 TaxID=1169145 RepID=UPI00037CD4FE|nr:RHS repeat-associated core domain-containing protein [Cryocola sp. 340MFSha3.1]
MRFSTPRLRWMTRGLIGGVAVVALTLSGTVTTAEASPAETSRRVAAATLAEVRAAAAEQEVRVREEIEAPAPQAQGTIRPGTESTVQAKDLGASATFSGNGVASSLTVNVGAAPANALRAAKAEAPGAGAPVSDPVEITAVNDAGEQVTQFPASTENRRGGGDNGPVVSDVIPGIALELKPDLSAVKAKSLDPSTLQIYTREGAGEPWTALPSYYDAKAGVVKGVSTHLSQFVVIGIPFPVPAGPVVVLDPDNDEGRASTPAPPVTELGYNIRLAQQVAALLEQDCRATVTITRQDPNQPFVPREIRAGMAAAADPVATLGIGFNTNQGTAWGSPGDGGSQVYSRGGAPDDALSNALVGVLPTYTNRPAKSLGNNGNFPGDEFAGLPNAFTHVEPLFLDHNYDRPVINEGMTDIANGVLTGLGVYLESQGFDCTDPVTGGWPSPPSAAEIARWRQLGHQNHQTYGGEPFSFSTGNLIEDEKLFSLRGPGGSVTDLTLTYNSQDGRLTRVGAGWSFEWGARAQRFIDGSVMVVRGDGASFVFTADGHGGYTTADAGVHQTLSEVPGGKLRLTDVSGESWVFDASNIDGIGNLVSYTDDQGHVTTLAYGPATDPKASQFYPLASITGPAGQVISVGSDALGRVTGFTRPGGDRWGLAYDGEGNLATITLPDGRTHSFTYDGAHQLLTGTDATGALYLKNQYDSQGRVVKQWDVEGNVRTLDYSTQGQTTYTDNLGRVSVYFYDAQSRITKVQHPDGTTASFRFDADNNVTSSTDENGARTAYTYDQSGNLTSETAPDGVVTKYTYSASGHVATKTDAGGPGGSPRTWTYDYDGSGRTVAVHQPDATIVRYAYDAAGNLVSSEQPSGATTTYNYDAAGRPASQTDPAGGVTRYSYDAAGRMLSQVDPGGHSTRYSWDSGDRVVTATNAVGSVFRYGWEPNDHLASLTDPTGAVTKYSWDAMFHLTDSTSPSGAVTTYGYTAEDSLSKRSDPLGGTASFTSDARDRTVKTVDPNGGTWSYSYDSVGNLTSVVSPEGGKTSYAYDTHGNLTAETSPTGSKTRYSYDSVGRLIKQIDADGVTTSYAYDLMDRVARITDGRGKHTDLAYDSDGNLTSVTDRGGAVTAYRYDAVGRVVSQTSPSGDVTSFGYDSDGNVTSVTDALGRTRSYSYDALEQLVAATDAEGSATAYAYDANGRTTSVTDPNGNVTAFTYDGDGNQVSTTDPVGGVTQYGWDAAGNQTSVTDAKGHRTLYGYDPAGQLVKVTEGHKSGAKPSPDTNVVSTYTYDRDGNLATITDPNGHTTRYTSDPSGRTTSETNPVGNTTSWMYTPAGRIAKTTTGTGATTALSYDKRGDLVRQDQAGAVATYEYDAEQRLIAMTDPTGVSGWVYDDDGRVTTQIDQSGGRLANAYDKAGQLASMTLPTGQKLTYTYDRAGKTTSQSSPWGSLAYAWDPAGNLTELQRSTGVTTTYAYDGSNRVTDVRHSTPAVVAGTTSTPSPKPAAYASGDATAAKCTTVAGYLSARSAPAAGESTLCTHTNTYLKGRTLPTASKPVPDGGSLAYHYDYDADGNLAGASRTVAQPTQEFAPKPGSTHPSGTSGRSTDSTPAAKAAPISNVTSVTYGYDRLDRLATSQTSSAEKNMYGYDAAGNRTSWSRSGAKDGDFAQTATFNDANQLTQSVTTGSGRGVSAGVASYSYDGAGNRVSQAVAGTGTSFAYNAAGQVGAVTREGRSTTYAYDGLGRRASVTDQSRYGTSTTRNSYDGAELVQANVSGQGTTTLVRDAAGALAEHVTSTGEATWDLLDGLGSTVAGARAGSVTELSSYDDWGAQRFESSGWSAPESYTGHPQDVTQGQVHTFARSYDPATGSWTTPDSWRGLLTEPASLGRYRYVSSNPVTFLDPDGHKCAPRTGASDALPLGCGAPPHKAYQDVKMPPEPPPYTPAKKDPPTKTATGPTWENDPSWRHALYESYWPAGINCDTQMKVGSSQQQLAINEACGKALSQASLSTQPQWVRDLVAANQAIHDAALPFVLIGITAAGGTAGYKGSSSYIDITKGGSVRNVATSVTRGDFERNLINAGWSKRVVGGGRATIFEKNGAKYSVRDENSSGFEGSTAEFTPSGCDGKAILKIRLGEG